MPSGAIMAQLLWATNCFLVGFAVCSPGGNCLPGTPDQKPTAEKVSGPMVKPNIVFTIFNFICLIDRKNGKL